MLRTERCMGGNARMLREWIDHILYVTEGIDDWLSQSGICWDVETLDKMNEKKLEEAYMTLKVYTDWMNV